MKIACLLITHFRAKVEIRRQPNLKDKTAVIVDPSGRRAQVVDSTLSIPGALPGVTLEQGLSIRAIARELGIHRYTARKYAGAQSPPMKRTKVRSRTPRPDDMVAA